MECLHFPRWDEGCTVYLVDRLRLSRGDALACGGQERVEARVCMQRLELVVFFQVLDIVDGTSKASA